MNVDSGSTLDLLQISRYYNHLLQGFFTTLGLYAFALVLGFGLGLVLAVARQYGGGISSRLASGFIEFFRGTPLLAQLLVVWYSKDTFNLLLEAIGLPTWDFGWKITVVDFGSGTGIFLSPRIILAGLTLALNSAAYQAIFFVGSMKSISAGQMMAARSIGMGKNEAIRNIVLPQTLRRVIPAWSNEAAYLPKYTTAAYIIGVEEFFAKISLVQSRTYLALESYILAAIIFLAFITVVSKTLDMLYERLKIPGF